MALAAAPCTVGRRSAIRVRTTGITLAAWISVAAAVTIRGSVAAWARATTAAARATVATTVGIRAAITVGISGVTTTCWISTRAAVIVGRSLGCGPRNQCGTTTQRSQQNGPAAQTAACFDCVIRQRIAGLAGRICHEIILISSVSKANRSCEQASVSFYRKRNNLTRERQS